MTELDCGLLLRFFLEDVPDVLSHAHSGRRYGSGFPTPHPASRIPYPASRIPHPAPLIPYPASRLPQGSP
jgi:hypothetical protein